MKLLAETRLLVAQMKSKGLITEADAEGTMAQNLDQKRRFEERMLQVEHFKRLMKDNKIIISGKNGEEFLNFFKEIGEMINSAS